MEVWLEIRALPVGNVSPVPSARPEDLAKRARVKDLVRAKDLARAKGLARLAEAQVIPNLVAAEARDRARYEGRPSLCWIDLELCTGSARPTRELPRLQPR